MRNIFIINPSAGKGKGNCKFAASIKDTALSLNIDTDIYVTKGVSDASEYVKTICENTAEEIRFFACGGDGTLNEVINGAFGYKNASVGCIPIGTGNDFVRNFSDGKGSTNIRSALLGSTKVIDLMKYTVTIGGGSHSGYAINMINIGFDCNVADMTAKLKKYPLIAGSFAYLLGVALMLCKIKGADLKIESSGRLLHEGSLLLTTVANGCFCGGGVKSNPLAMLDNGSFDWQLIKPISRLTLIRFFGKYSKGTHLDASVSSFLEYRPLKELHITALGDAPMLMAIDGEIIQADELHIEILPACMKFIVPADAATD